MEVSGSRQFYRVGCHHIAEARARVVAIGVTVDLGVLDGLEQALRDRSALCFHACMVILLSCAC